MSALEKIIRPARIGEPFNARVLAPVQPAVPALVVPEISWVGGADTSVQGPPSISSITVKFTWSEDTSQRQVEKKRIQNPQDATQYIDIERIKKMVLKNDQTGETMTLQPTFADSV